MNTYKIFKTSCALFCACIFAHFANAEEIMIAPQSVGADATLDGRYVISNAADPAKTSKAKVTYDLSKFTLAQTAFATIYVSGLNGEPAEGLSSCLYAKCDGKIVGTSVMNARGNETGAKLIVTDAVNAAFKAGKKEISFTLEQRGIAGKQRAFLMGKIAPLGLQNEETVPYSLKDYLRPVWKPGVMNAESVFFLGPQDGGAARANLLFKPKKIISARSGDLLTEYKEGEDFTLEGCTVILTPNSKIKAFAYDDFYLKTAEAKDADGKPVRTFKFAPLDRYALSPEGAWFQAHQIFFTYEHDGDGWQSRKFAESFAPNLLPKTHALLNSSKPVKIILFGDSISAGANASGRASMRPYMTSFGDIIAEALRKYYKKDNITYINPSLGGATFAWALKHVDTLVAAEKPDLVIIAFGMNDGSKPDKYAADAKQVMEHVLAQNPDAEFILAAPMQANALWRKLAPHEGYAAELSKMQKPGVFVADIWNAHAQLLKNKKYCDMTGNNVNHPNDFLIRVYAQVIAEPLLPLD